MTRAPDEVVLITGFPRLGARKLMELTLESDPDAHVSMVVLPKVVEQACEALVSLPKSARSRVEILEGDAAAMDLGLSGHEFRQLAARVTRIHHLAYASYVGVDRDAAEYTNVHGAIEMVELGRACERLRCLVHHSTAHVSGDRTGLVYEDELDCGQGFHSPVQESRMKAEKVMRRAMPDLPIAVVRPTMLVGDSITGEADRFDGPYLLVMFLLGMPGDMPVPLPTGTDNPLDIVPVDFVTRAAHAIGSHPEAPGLTVHLTSSEELTARAVFDLLAEAGGRRTRKSVIPTQIASVLMRTPGLERFVKEPRAFLQQLASPSRYDTRNARRLLAGTGIECPPLASYVDTWVTAVKEHMRRRRDDRIDVEVPPVG